MDALAIDPRAEENGLALMLHGLLAENLAADPKKRDDLAAIRTRFAVVAPDAEVQVSLWFEHGHCTVYDGVKDGTEVTITADSGKIPELSMLHIRYGLPWVLDEAGQAFLRALLVGEIRIAGLVDLPVPHPLATLRRAYDLVRLTRILSVA